MYDIPQDENTWNQLNPTPIFISNWAVLTPYIVIRSLNKVELYKA